MWYVKKEIPQKGWKSPLVKQNWKCDGLINEEPLREVKHETKGKCVFNNENESKREAGRLPSSWNLWTTPNIEIASEQNVARRVRTTTIEAMVSKRKQKNRERRDERDERTIGPLSRSTWKQVDRLETGRDFYGSCFPSGHKSFI